MTPTAYRERSAVVFADRLAVVDGDLRLTYAEFHDRSQHAPDARVALLGPDGGTTDVI